LHPPYGWLGNSRTIIQPVQKLARYRIFIPECAYWLSPKIRLCDEYHIYFCISDNEEESMLESLIQSGCINQVKTDFEFSARMNKMFYSWF
jgi:hypothetical protein